MRKVTQAETQRAIQSYTEDSFIHDAILNGMDLPRQTPTTDNYEGIKFELQDVLKTYQRTNEMRILAQEKRGYIDRYEQAYKYHPNVALAVTLTG